MPNYDLDRLGDKEFERLCQSLLKFVIGSGTITFGEGRDGGREATFSGKAPYPSETDSWEGDWIFQAKYHNVKLIGADEARKQVLSDLRSELDKIVNKYKYHCDNYILITNVPLSSVSRKGTHDRIALEVAPEFATKIPHIHVWGADELYRFLERYSELRRAYMHFITPGDLIAELMDKLISNKSKLAETIRLYLRTCFNQEQYAQLDQAGEVGEERMPLQRVFIDLEVTPRYEERASMFSLDLPLWLRKAAQEKKAISAMKTLLGETTSKTTLIGGPGQGKSTLGQYLAQLHRATLLDFLARLSDANKLVPLVARLPFRIILKEYAQWILDTKSEQGLEFYIANNVKERAARGITADEIQDIIKNNPCLLIFDGLDEVTDRSLRIRMLDQITSFLDRCEDILHADIQVIATSRPTGYSNQFDPAHFFHLNLVTLTPAKVTEYVDRWVAARAIDRHKALQLKSSIKECAEDRQVQLLMNTPLQVTILVLIILSGGTPPKQREGLFDEYLEVIYKREKTKAKWIIQTEKPVLFGLHKYLGYVLHSSATSDHNVLSSLKEAAFIKNIREYLRFNDPYSPADEIDKQINLIVEEARDRLVLIVELTSGDFGFELRSLQEFFAAGHLTDTAKNSNQRYERFEAIARSSQWRNVALFFAGRVGRAYEGEAANILEVCKDIDRREPDIFLRRGAWLALDLASDRSFGPNRKLQRSLIEYCLPIVETDINEEQLNSLKSAIGRIPPEDTRDHLRPVIEEKLQHVQLPFLEFYMDIFFSTFGVDGFLLGLIDKQLQNEDIKSVAWTIQKALSYEVEPDWLSKRLQQLLHLLTPASFAEVFSTKLLDNPKYIQACLDGCDIDITKIIVLLDKAFRERNPMRVGFGSNKDKLYEITLDLSTPRQQMWTSIALFNLITITTQEYAYRSRHGGIRLDPGDIDRFSEEIKRHGLIKADLDSISELVERDDLLLQTKAVLWALQVILRVDSAEILKRFIDFYNSNKSKSPWLINLFTPLSYYVHPFFRVLLDSADTYPDQIDFIIDLFSHRDIYEKSIQMFSSEVDGFISHNGADAVQYIAKVSAFGRAAIRTPASINLDSLERDTNIPLEIGLSLLQIAHRYSDKLKLSAEEVYLILNNLKNLIFNRAESSRVVSLSWSLFHADWGTDEKITQTIKDISIYLDELTLDEDILSLAGSLWLKQTIHDINSDETSRRFLYTIGRNLSLGLIIPTVWEAKVAAKLLTELTPYVGSEDSTIQAGAVRLASAIIKDAEYSKRYFLGSHVAIDKLLRKSFFNSRTMRKYIGDPIPEKRVDGIRLLVVSDFKITEDGNWIFSAIKNCDSDEEAEAWAFFIKYARVSFVAKALKLWITNLTTILKNKASYHPTIRRAVLESYERLIKHRESKLSLDEIALDLPLNIGSPGIN